MTTTAIIKEINKLSVNERLLLVEKMLKSIRQEKQNSIAHSVSLLYNDYKTDQELTAFTSLDAQTFYETRCY